MALGLSILLVVLLALVLSAVVGLGVVGLLGWGAFKGLKALGNSVKRLLGAPAEPVRTDVPPMPAGVDEQASPSPSEPKREASSRASRDAQAQPRAHDFEYLDVEKGATAEHISQVMQGYVDDYLVGDYAHAVIEELSGAEFRRTRLFAEIDGRFAHGSLSWERFASTATEALDAILRNCALLANRVQAFDATDYARMEQFFASGGLLGAWGPRPHVPAALEAPRRHQARDGRDSRGQRKPAA